MDMAAMLEPLSAARVSQQHLATSLGSSLPGLLLNLLQAAPLRCSCMLVFQVLLDLGGALALPVGRQQLVLHSC